MQTVQGDVFNEHILEYTVNFPAVLYCCAFFCTDRVFLQDIQVFFLDLPDCDPFGICYSITVKGNEIPDGDGCM